MTLNPFVQSCATKTTVSLPLPILRRVQPKLRKHFPMQPDLAQKRPGRPVGWRKPQPPSAAERMADALCIWRCDLDDDTAVEQVLRLAGFGLMDVARHADEAAAAAKARTGRP
jgi:hypothetical protein